MVGWSENDHTHKSLVLMRVGSRCCRISKPNWKRVGGRPYRISESNWKLHVMVAIRSLPRIKLKGEF